MRVAPDQSAANHTPRSAAEKWRGPARLLSSGQAVLFVLLTAMRVAVGFCDLALAASLYVLFLLLQGHTLAHQYRFIPKSVLEAATLAAVLVVVRAITDVGSARLVFRQIQGLQTDLLLRLTLGYSEMDWTSFVTRNRSELAGHALHATREAADFYHQCVELVAGVMIVAVMTLAFVYQNAFAALGFASTLAALYCVHRFIVRGRVQEAATRRKISQSGLQRLLSDMFLSGKEIRTYDNQAFFQRRIRELASSFASSNRTAVMLPQAARSFADQGTILLFLVLIAAAQLTHGNTGQMLALIVCYFVLSRRLLPLVSQISLIAGQMESSLENVRTVESELAECNRCRTVRLPASPPAQGFVLQLENLTFSYDDELPILRGVKLEVRPGESVVLYGRSGSGKTSLLNLIAGIATPKHGVVRVDRSMLAYVPQEIPLLDDTIRNNLLFGLQPKRDEELWHALADAELDEFVASLPDRLETSVGDNGALFSGGERQRLGMARAVLRAGQLLLLDEATSALDEENERRVLENLSASGKAVVMVTHRRRAHCFAQRIFRLQAGDLIEERRAVALEDRFDDDLSGVDRPATLPIIM